MNIGTLVLGVLNGLTIGLLAVGLVLVYKANRFLNLAHASLGTLSAMLLSKWVLDWGWNWWVAFLLAVGVGAATGLLVERWIIGRARRLGGSPVRLLLLSVAVSQILLGLTFVPDLAPRQIGSQPYPQPFTSHISVGGVILNGTFVVTAVLVPLTVLGLAAFLRFSMFGKGMRAAANNPDAARLAGISVGRVSAVSWAVAGGLAAVSAILQAPQQNSFSQITLGPYLLMLTLGAAAFGAFVSLPAALGGGLVLGLVGQFVSAETANGADAELAIFAVILLVVLVRGRAMASVFSLAGVMAETQPVLRVPQVLKDSTLVRFSGWWLGAVGVVIALIVPNLPYFSSSGHRFLLVLVLIYALLGVALTMLIGWAGQVSMGHFAVVGISAFLTARWSDELTLPALLLVGGLIGAVVMILVGLPALRVGGLALAVTTMGFAVITSDWLLHQSWVGSTLPFATVVPAELGPGLGTAGSQLTLFYVALAVLVLAAATASALRRLGPGRVMIAVRDNELAATSFGVNPPAMKLAILGVTGFFAAAAGVLWAQSWQTVSTEQFSPNLSVAIIALPVIGGLGSVGGAIAAAAALYMMTFFVGPHVSGLFGDFGHNLGFQLLLAGFGQIGVLLSYPNGIAGAAQARWQKTLDRRAHQRHQRQDSESHLIDLPESTLRARAVAEPAAEPSGPALRLARGEAVGDPRTPPRGDAGEQEPLLLTSGVTVRFGGVVALSGPEIQVLPGEIVGLIGPNGAGKTTLMNVISGVLKCEAGSVRVCGHEVVNVPPDLRTEFGVARTFQNARLFGGLTVTETIQVAMAYHRKVGVVSALVASPWARANEERSRLAAAAVIERFGLTAWADTALSDLSTGTRRICDLAAQVATRPKLLLLDEPTAGVAQREAEAFGPLLRRIRDELDCGILIVEHDMPLLMGLCDRVFAMEAGQVVATGTPAEVRNNPRVVAGYLGSNETAVGRSGTQPPSTVNGTAPATCARSPRRRPPSAAAPTKVPS